MTHSTTPRTRRSFLHGSLLTSLATVVALPVPDVVAAPNDARGPTSIASRVKSHRELCKIGGGKLGKPQKTPFGSTITQCNGGDAHGHKSVHTKKKSYCKTQKTMTRPDVPDHTLQPAAPFVAPAEVPDHTFEQGLPLADPGDASDQPLQ